MMHSMTAFSRLQAEHESLMLSWELRSVNHRYLDISFRLPEQFRYLETNCRAIMRDKIARGKVECSLKLTEQMGNTNSLMVNEGLVNALIKVSKEVAALHHLADDMTLSQILTWPGVVMQKVPVVETLEKRIETLFADATQMLVQSRKTEGSSLTEQLKKRVQLIHHELSGIKENVAIAQQLAREKLLKKLDNIQIEVVDARVAQELAMLLTRMDISEEIDRIEVHLKDVISSFEAKEPMGRRLDFLMQELSREINTLSAKSDSLIIAGHSLQIKVLIDQMREQIQNLE